MMLRDQYHDPAYGLLVHLLEGNPDAAAFVKTAELDDAKVAELPDTSFAWPERRFFPIDSPENTVLSCLYRQKCATVVPVEVDEALQRAQAVYNVSHLVQAAKTAAEAAVPPPEAPEDFLLPQHQMLRVKTAADVPVAEQLLLEQYPRLSIEDRAEGFINLCKKAQDLGVSLKPTTLRMAGMTICTTKTAQDWIEARQEATKEPLFKSAYQKLAAGFVGKPTIHDRDELVAAADALAQLDKAAGIAHLYDKKLPDPIRTIFNTDKVASEMVDLAGREVALDKLAAMPVTFWEDTLGKHDAREVVTGGQVDATKLAQVVPTLPLDLKLILKHQVP